MAAAPSAISDRDQLEELLEESLAAASCAGQSSAVVSVDELLPSSEATAPELAAGLALGSAAKTLATPHVLSTPARVNPRMTAFSRERCRTANASGVAGCSGVDSI
jgi:hypothetical protein